MNTTRTTENPKSNPLHLRNNDYTQKSEREAAIDGELRNLNREFLQKLGDRSWNLDMQVLLKRQVLSRVIHCHETYKHILLVSGSILEFGEQWGATLATLTSLRGMFEPCNHARKIIGFDASEGFSSVTPQDASEYRNYLRREHLYYFDRLHVNYFTVHALSLLVEQWGLHVFSSDQNEFEYKDGHPFSAIYVLAARRLTAANAGPPLLKLLNTLHSCVYSEYAQVSVVQQRLA